MSDIAILNSNEVQNLIDKYQKHVKVGGHIIGLSLGIILGLYFLSYRYDQIQTYWKFISIIFIVFTMVGFFLVHTNGVIVDKLKMAIFLYNELKKIHRINKTQHEFRMSKGLYRQYISIKFGNMEYIITSVKKGSFKVLVVNFHYNTHNNVHLLSPLSQIFFKKRKSTLATFELPSGAEAKIIQWNIQKNQILYEVKFKKLKNPKDLKKLLQLCEMELQKLKN